jgi:hypothetical protein
MFKQVIITAMGAMLLMSVSTTDVLAKTIANAHHHSHSTPSKALAKQKAKANIGCSRPVLRKVVKDKPPTTKGNLGNFIKRKCRHNCIDVDNLYRALNRARDEFDVSPKLVLSVITVESMFNKKAVNGSTVGLMQVSKTIHRKKFKGKDPYNSYSNIQAGTHVLKDCLVKHNGKVNKALSCYNGGGDPMYTAKVRKVMSEVGVINLASGHINAG